MQLIDTKGVARKLSIHPNRVYVFLREDATFPKPFKLTRKMNRWVESEVEEWIRHKKGETDGEGN
jgi:predicted DNA-binding transcriptional regulator AlpA